MRETQYCDAPECNRYWLIDAEADDSHFDPLFHRFHRFHVNDGVYVCHACSIKCLKLLVTIMEGRYKWEEACKEEDPDTRARMQDAIREENRQAAQVS